MAFRLIVDMPGKWQPGLSRLGWLSGLVILLCLSPALLAQSPLEHRVKAAFLFNFTKFVEWPSDSFPAAYAPIDMCLYGDDPIGAEIDRIVVGKKVNGHPLRVRRIDRSGQLSDCKLIYFAGTGTRMAEVLASLRNQSVLTVSDDPRFIRMGGMIRFLIVDNKLRFEINRNASERAGLKISSKLLSVAQAVHEGAGD